MAEIEARGGYLCGNDDFEIVMCANCGCQYLYNNEVLDLYYNPDDLTDKYLNAVGHPCPPCRRCKMKEWDWVQMDEEDMRKVKAGPWAWAIDDWRSKKR